MTSEVDQLIHHLEQLQTTNYEDRAAARAHHADADAALRLIFHIGRQRVAFTKEQQRAVAAALVAAIRPLQINIQNHSFEITTRPTTIILKKRSAIQFLADDYGTFRIPGNGKLSAVFERVLLAETIQILDEIIEEYREDEADPDYELVKRFREEFGSREDLSDRDLPGIPPSHSWWT